MEGCLSDYQLFLGDCFQFFKTLEDGSVDAIISDPPFNMTEADCDKTPLDIVMMFAELRRIAKPNAPIVLFSAQPFTADLINAARDIFRFEFIACKTRGTSFFDVKKRFSRAHENVLVFSKKEPTFNPQMEQGEPYSAKRNGRQIGVYGIKTNTNYTESNGERYPLSYKTFSWGNNATKLHPFQKPEEAMVYLVNTFSNLGETILDPFMGSGSTGVAALKMGRCFIGCEEIRGHFETAKQRLEAVKAQPKLLELV
jgi:site-specific DNA-methyltransferase (adenine-specific)